MDRLAPVAIWTDLALSEPSIGLGDPISQVWQLVYLPGEVVWELRYSYGLVVYRQSRPWSCTGPNVFDVITHDATGDAPASVTLWPFTPIPCECPEQLAPTQLVLTLTPEEPEISTSAAAILEPLAAILALTPAAPKICEPGGAFPARHVEGYAGGGEFRVG